MFAMFCARILSSSMTPELSGPRQDSGQGDGCICSENRVAVCKGWERGQDKLISVSFIPGHQVGGRGLDR